MLLRTLPIGVGRKGNPVRSIKWRISFSARAMAAPKNDKNERKRVRKKKKESENLQIGARKE